MILIFGNRMIAKSLDKTKVSKITPVKESDESHEDIFDIRSKMIQKRSDVIEWDEYFMSVAYLSAMRSKDPSTQVGACIVNEDNRIVGIGYNGFPRGCRCLN